MDERRSWNCCDFILGERRRHTIPSIIVYKSQKKGHHCGYLDVNPTKREGWQKVGNSHLHLYSAYWDNRLSDGDKFIRILAMSKGAFHQKTFCRVWRHDSDSYASEIETQELWVSSWDMAETHQYYRPLLLSCRVDGVSPPAVSVTTEICQKPDNILLLNSATTRWMALKDFAVCLKPLNFEKDITARLVEWLEFQYLLGADKVIAYVYNLPSQALYVLKGYEKLGKVVLKHPTLLRDDTNKTSEQKVWQKRRYEMMIYNDCFYSHIHSHKFVVNLDLDEAIVPIKDDSWMSLLKRASQQNRRLYQFASIAAANVYFFESFGRNSNGSVPHDLYMLRHLYRSANFTPPGFAQKSFFLTNSTLVATNHYALRTLYHSVGTNTALGKDIVQLHHYRHSCPPKMGKECDDNYLKYKIRDPIILKFKKRLIENIKLRVKQFNLTILNGENEENT